MIFYTTTPWLYPAYAPIVFQKNYNCWREIETIVAHEHLFQLKTVQDGKVLVEETTNEAVRNLALYEIQTFKTMSRRWLTPGAVPEAVGAAGGVYSTPGATSLAGQRPHPDCRRRAAGQQQGKRAEAWALLASIYDWFTEGFDTADLQEARALLEALRP